MPRALKVAGLTTICNFTLLVTTQQDGLILENWTTNWGQLAITLVMCQNIAKIADNIELGLTLLR